MEERTKVLQIFAKKIDEDDARKREYEITITAGTQLALRLTTLSTGKFELRGMNRAKELYKEWTEKAKRLAA